MKYRAKEKGFRNGSVVEEGATFEADDFKGSWAEPVEEPKKRGRPKKSETSEAVEGKEPAPEGK